MSDRNTQLGAEQIQALVQNTYQDPWLFCQTFLRDWFPGKPSWAHLGVLAILDRRTDFLLKHRWALPKIIENFVIPDDPDDPQSPLHPMFEWDQKEDVVHLTLGKFTMVMMPRGFSKTTLCNAMVLKKVLFRETKFIVYVSETATHAGTQLGNVKGELVGNEMIRAVFGDLKPPSNSGLRWAEDFAETSTGIALAARGRGGQVRGMNNRGNRPDYIIVDDVEDKESVSTPEQRAKTRTWAFGDLMPALPRIGSGTITALGTLLHSEALLEVWRRSPQWTAVKLAALDLAGEPIWPEAMTKEQLEAVKKDFALAGELNTYYLEYHNQIRNEETAKFRQSFFIWDKPEVDPELVSIAIDPAISDKPGADFCSIAVTGMTDKGRIVVLDMWGKRGASPREQVDQYFERVKRYNTTQQGVEAIAYQAALVHLLREEMFRKKRYFEIKPITHTMKKTERIEGVLQPRYANGYIIHSRRFPELEQQLLDWPNGKKDFPDALAMAITLLDPYAAQAADPNMDLGDNEYAPLDEVLGTWELRV